MFFFFVLDKHVIFFFGYVLYAKLEYFYKIILNKKNYIEMIFS